MQCGVVELGEAGEVGRVLAWELLHDNSLPHGWKVGQSLLYSMDHISGRLEDKTLMVIFRNPFEIGEVRSW